MNLSDIFDQPKPAKPEVIKEYETMIGHALPQEFRAYLEQFNTRHKLECYCGPKQQIYIQNIYYLTSPDEYCDLRFELGRGLTIPKSNKDNLVPIGYANGGDPILLSLNNDNIFIHNHEDDSIEFVEESFSSFLSCLKDDFPDDD